MRKDHLNRISFWRTSAGTVLPRGRCAMPSCRKIRLLVQDHSHASGRNRDWLCRPCNAHVGLVERKPDHHAEIRAYLRKHQREHRLGRGAIYRAGALQREMRAKGVLRPRNALEA